MIILELGQRITKLMRDKNTLVIFFIMFLSLVFCVIQLARDLHKKSFAVVLKDPRSSINPEILKVLDDCAEKNTSFLKGKITQESIERFRKYCRTTFRRKTNFLCALYSFKQSDWPGMSGTWSVEHVTRSNCPEGVAHLLKWLQQNYTPLSDFQFFYYSMEPYNAGWNLEQNIQDEIGNLLDACPLLITCRHPDLSWTKKTVLIPDFYILDDSFHQRMGLLLRSKEYSSLDELDSSSEKGLVPFCKRKPYVYFRGALSGPKLPFTRENMVNNPRHYLLTLLKGFSFIDFKVTDFLVWKYEAQSDYLEYLLNNFSEFKSSGVDFFEHAKNKYLLSCDGYGAAWSRLQLIMATRSVLFLNAQCEQYFYSFMENNKTHIRINKDFSNLEEEFCRLEADQEMAQKIGEQGREFARKFFTKEAIDTYLWLVLHKLEKVSRAA